MKKEKKQTKKRPLLLNLYKGVKIPWLSLIFGSFLAVFNALVILTQYDNYNAIFSGNMQDLSPLWAYLIASFIQYVLIFATVICDLGYVKIVTGVRKKMWAKMVRLPMKTYDEQSASGLLSRITSDAEFASRPFYVIIVLLQIFIYVLSISSAAPQNLPQALVILIITLSMSVIAIVISAKMASKATTDVQNVISKQTSNYVEQLGNIKFIKATNSQEKAISRANELVSERYQAALYRSLANALQTLASNCTYIIIYSCAFLGGIFAIKAGSISDIQPVNEVYVFGMACEATLLAIMMIPTYFASTFGGSKKIVEVFNFPQENIVDGQPLTTVDADIILDKVNFKYSDKQIINDATFTIEKGKVTAIVGPNGSGKSTIINLIDRLYECDNGNLMIGKQNAKDVSIKSWREKFAYVSQKPSLFAGSIKENICYGLENIDEAKLQDVISKTNLQDIIDAHVEGIDYNVGVNGCKLSGGQQQKVAIARALMKDPSYLILDEATANLDIQNEQAIKEALKHLMKDRTVIIVSHNFNFISEVDNVIVINEGKIIDKGSFEEVVKNNNFLNQMAQ